MDILIVSGRRVRAASAEAHPSQAQARSAAEALAERGHRVRWLCMLDMDEAEPRELDGVECVVTRSAVPGFRAVVGRVCEVNVETVLTEQLRAERADVVHLFTLGASAPAQLPWIAERFDVPAIVDVDLARSVCHRESLVRSDGSACEAFDDPQQCTRCCLTASSEGLGAVGAVFGRAALLLGGLSPWPQSTDFLNRLDLVVGSGLGSTVCVRVEDEAAKAQLIAAGLGKRIPQVGQSMAVAELEALYAQHVPAAVTTP